MIHALLFNVWFFHPLDEGTGSTCSAINHTGCGYAGWSGILGSFLTSVPGWIVAIVVFLYARNCHVRGCWRLQWHEHPDHGHPVCRKHHPHGHGRLHEIPTTPATRVVARERAKKAT